MRKPKIVKDFLRNTDAQLEIQTNSILSAMTNNVNFTSPVPTLAEVKLVLGVFSTSLSVAQHRDSILVAAKNKAREVLEGELSRLSNYVMLMSGDDRAKMASSAFTLSSATASSSNIGELQNFKVEVGKVSGSATLSVKALKGSSSTFYQFYYAKTSEPNVWLQVESRYPIMIVTGLDPLTTYLFRIKATGVKDQTAETGIITKGVL